MSESAPYATEPAVAIDQQLHLGIDLRRSRCSHWLIFLTGVGSDGARYRLAGPSSLHSSYTGTIWDWVTASD
jgi:hypothetical protein